jgi:hypothetical protein
MACNTAYATPFPARDFAATNSSSAKRLTAKSITACDLGTRKVDLLSAGSDKKIQLQAPPQLTVSTQYTLPAVDGAPGDVLSTDGAGSMVWTGGSASGGSACQCFDSNSATPFQIKNATNVTKIIEFDAAAITPGTNRVFVAPDTNGILPGQPSAGSLATGNVTYPMTGSGNTYYGVIAGSATTGGAYNTGTGLAALANNTIGNHNTGYGNNALPGVVGDGNTGAGSNALASVGNSQNFNSGFGYYAGSNLFNGSRNTFLGHNTQPNTNSDNNCIVMGNDAVGNGDNTITIGDTNVETAICLAAPVPLTMDYEVRIKIGANVYRLHATIL